MDIYQTIAVLLTLAAAAAFVNEKYLHLPSAIGLMAITLLVSVILVAAGKLGIVPTGGILEFVASIDFSGILLRGMLSFLLFAGALHVDINDLMDVRLPVSVLATVGVLLATFIIGSLFWLVLGAVGFSITYLQALLFGALVSPTDPIAVLGILRTARAPKSVEMQIAGESLFNDGVGVVVFMTLLAMESGTHSLSAVGAFTFFAEEVIGGVVLGSALGYAVYRMMRSVDAYQVEILLSLSLVAGGYALAEAVHVSAPIAMVAAGLFMGNHGRIFGMSERTREELDRFWELVDEILNALLFVIIGLEIIAVDLSPGHMVVGMAAVVLVLCGRFVSVAIPVRLMALKRRFRAGITGILTWGGLRGGISIALALSLPKSPERDLILAATYMVVVFSLLVQGLTFGAFIRKVLAREAG